MPLLRRQIFTLASERTNEVNSIMFALLCLCNAAPSLAGTVAAAAVVILCHGAMRAQQLSVAKSKMVLT